MREVWGEPESMAASPAWGVKYHFRVHCAMYILMVHTPIWAFAVLAGRRGAAGAVVLPLEWSAGLPAGLPHALGGRVGARPRRNHGTGEGGGGGCK